MASPHVSSLTGNSDKCKCFQKCHSSSFGSRSKAWLLQKIFERSSKTLSSVWSYIKVPPAKSVLATICCGLSLIGMLLEYYCTLGGIVQVSLHCYPMLAPVVTIRHGQLAQPKLGPVYVQGSNPYENMKK